MWWMWLGVCVAWGADDPLLPAPSVRTEALPEGGVRLVPDRQVPQALDAADEVMLEFGDVSLYDLTLYFADVLRKNFVVTDRKGLEARRVQLIGHDTMTVQAAWEAYLSALRAHGFSTSESGDVTHIVALADAARGPRPIGTGAPGSTVAVVTRLLPLTAAQASDLVSVVRPLLSSEAQLTAYAPANTLIITDTGENVQKVAELVGELDVAAPSSSVALTRLTWADADEVRAVIEALYPIDDSPTAPPKSKSRRGRPEPTPEPTTAGTQARHLSRVLSDTRTNALIVLANPQGHAAVAEIVAELDVDVDPSTRSKLHVLTLSHAMAEEVVAVLEGLQEKTPERPPGRLARPADGAALADPDIAAALDGSARIAADPATNSLAIVADPAEYEAIANLVGQLDVARGQVFVDAVFVELTNSGGNELSLSAHLLPDDGQPLLGAMQLDDGVHSLDVSPDLLSGLAAGVFGPLIEVIGPDGSALQVPTFGIALRALQTHSDVQVMGNPALLALDHHEATLSVGRKIPYETSSQASTLGVPIRTFDRLDVAMDLTVTPHINDLDTVTLDIDLSVDEVEGAGAESSGEGGPVTSDRTLGSRVQVEDGQTIVIAGMTGTKLEVVESKVPILGDIPVLGVLFRSRRRETRSTNLMVFLTPHIVHTPADLLTIRQIKEAQRAEFVRRFQQKDGRTWLEELYGLLDDASDEP